MPINEELFGAKNEAEVEGFAVEDLIFDVQMLLQSQMADKGVNQKELAVRLQISAARVSQLFANEGGNMTLATLARMAHALSLVARVEFEPKGTRAKRGKRIEQIEIAESFLELQLNRTSVWHDYTANHNCEPEPYLVPEPLAA